MKINIKEKLSQSGMSKYELAKKINITYPTISKIYASKTTSINFQILEGLCKELHCTPNDILIPDDETVKSLCMNTDW